jgi:hypothetical protein
LGIPVMKGKIRGSWAGEARPTPPIFYLTPAITKETGEKIKGLFFKSNITSSAHPRRKENPVTGLRSLQTSMSLGCFPGMLT